VTRLFSGSDDDVEEVSGEFYEQVTVIDAGENTARRRRGHRPSTLAGEEAECG
jgi:hypothetical protein